MKSPIAYIRERPGLSAEDQRELAVEAGCTSIYEHGEHKGHDMRAAWVRSLGIAREHTAWVARLDVLLKPKEELPPGVRPSRDLATVLSVAAGKAHIIVEGTTGATSSFTQEWQDRVSWAMHRASSGIAKNIEAQRAHGKRGGKITRSRSVVVKWSARKYDKQRADAAVLWRDPACERWQDVVPKLPEELHGLSFTSLWRLLGPRKPKRRKAKPR